MMIFCSNTLKTFLAQRQYLLLGNCTRKVYLRKSMSNCDIPLLMHYLSGDFSGVCNVCAILFYMKIYIANFFGPKLLPINSFVFCNQFDTDKQLDLQMSGFYSTVVLNINKSYYRCHDIIDINWQITLGKICGDSFYFKAINQYQYNKYIISCKFVYQ